MAEQGEARTRGTVAVTGARRGIGAAIARELARRGYTVASLVRDPSAATGDAVAGGSGDARNPGRAASAGIVTIACDIRDPAAVESALAAANALPGGLVGLVNNAAIQNEGPAHEFALTELDAMLHTNVTGTFSVSQRAYPYLRARGGGLIVNLGSIWEKLGVKRYAAYCASKAAVSALGRCLAAEWARDGIRVLTVAPGYVETEMTRGALADERVQRFLATRIPMRRAASTDEVARLVASLFSEDIPMLTGETIYIDGGHGIAQ